MTSSFKKILCSGALAAMCMSATPASATYWWNWSGSGHSQTNSHGSKKYCNEYVNSVKYRSGKYQSRASHSSSSQARYAYTFDSHRKLRNQDYQDCVKVITYRCDRQSRK